MNYEILQSRGGAPIKAWIRGVPLEEAARRQLYNLASLDFVHGHVAVMPDAHYGIGSAVGSVFAARGAIIPAAVGVDIGCGMIAQRTSVKAAELPDSLARLRAGIEAAVPHGGMGREGGWRNGAPPRVERHFEKSGLGEGLRRLGAKYPELLKANSLIHLGTLGGGNHFIELCLDEEQRLWIMLHSGSRGVGNRIGRSFITRARERLEHGECGGPLPDRNLAWFRQGDDLFNDYLDAVAWAQDFALSNRRLMLERTLEVLRRELPPFSLEQAAVNCHHNYVARERHFGAEVWVTRKGAVRAGAGELGIIPGSMGTRSYIVRGKGNPQSFESCSHGAGRAMSRGEAKRRFSLKDHRLATSGVECRKDRGVLDETPAAYKDIDAVLAAQGDLVEIAHTLKQVVCVKG